MTALDVSQSFEREGARVLAEIEAMSGENATDALMASPVGQVLRPLWWYDAYAEIRQRKERDRVVRALFALVPGVTHFDVSHVLTRPVTERQPDPKRWVMPLRVGTKPANYVQLRPGYRDALAQALSWRSRCARDYSSGFVSAVVRTTHRKVHEALAGDDTRGCKWCAEGDR